MEVLCFGSSAPDLLNVLSRDCILIHGSPWPGVTAMLKFQIVEEHGQYVCCVTQPIAMGLMASVRLHCVHSKAAALLGARSPEQHNMGCPGGFWGVGSPLACKMHWFLWGNSLVLSHYSCRLKNALFVVWRCLSRSSQIYLCFPPRKQVNIYKIMHKNYCILIYST